MKIFFRSAKKAQPTDHSEGCASVFWYSVFPNGVEKMIGLWYNAVNLLEGELFDDVFKRIDPDHA